LGGDFAMTHERSSENAFEGSPSAATVLRTVWGECVVVKDHGDGFEVSDCSWCGLSRVVVAC
jgi:hypothetical protein